MKWPQITLIVWMAMSAGINLVKHGEPRNDTYNFIATAIALGIEAWVLYKGGFFG